MAQRPQPSVGIDQQALVASLEQMPVFLPQPVEAQGECPLQPLHSLHQVRRRGFQGDVIVVGHQAPRVHHPTRLRTGFIQTLQECRFGLLGPEDLGTVVPAVENMVDRPLLLETQLPWHDAASLRNRIAPVNYNLHDLTLLVPRSRVSTSVALSRVNS